MKSRISERHTLDGDVCDLRVFEDETEVIMEDVSLGTSERGRESDLSRRFRCLEGNELVLVVFETVKKPNLLGCAKKGSELRISMFGLWLGRGAELSEL